jgi:hypothetical protein
LTGTGFYDVDKFKYDNDYYSDDFEEVYFIILNIYIVWEWFWRWYWGGWIEEGEEWVRIELSIRYL